MNAGATSERVYADLKERLLSGKIAPGERLEPGRLADELTSSATPVRDALHRLNGESLVETRASEGFYLPHVTEGRLRDLYAWHNACLHAATRLWRRSTIAVSANTLSADMEGATVQMFALFAARADSDGARRTLASLSDQLASARHAERCVLRDGEQELRDLAVAFDQATPAQLLRLVDAYHRRRAAAAPAIVRQLYRAP